MTGNDMSNHTNPRRAARRSSKNVAAAPAVIPDVTPVNAVAAIDDALAALASDAAPLTVDVTATPDAHAIAADALAASVTPVIPSASDAAAPALDTVATPDAPAPVADAPVTPANASDDAAAPAPRVVRYSAPGAALTYNGIPLNAESSMRRGGFALFLNGADASRDDVIPLLSLAASLLAACGAPDTFPCVMLPYSYTDVSDAVAASYLGSHYRRTGQRVSPLDVSDACNNLAHRILRACDRAMSAKSRRSLSETCGNRNASADRRSELAAHVRDALVTYAPAIAATNAAPPAAPSVTT